LSKEELSFIAIAEETARGAFFLFGGSVVATLLSAICGIIVARLLGPELYGAYSLVFTVVGFLSVFTGLGVNAALTKYISSLQGARERGVLVDVIKVGVLFITLESLIVSLLGYVFVRELTTWLVNRPELATPTLVLLPVVFFQSIIVASTGILLGFTDTKRIAIVSIAQQALRSILAPLLIVAGMGLTGALLGNTLAYAISATIAGVYAYKYYSSLVKQVKHGAGRLQVSILREMVVYGAPLYASSVISSLVDVYRNALLSRIASDYVVGSFNVAFRFVVLITIVMGPISTALFPAFSKLSGNSGDLQRMFTLAVKYSSLLVVPITIFSVVMSRELVVVLFGRGYLELTPHFFALIALNYLYVVIGYMVLGSFFSGVGKTRVNLESMLIYSGLFIALATPLSSIYGVYGLLYTMLVTNGVSTLYALYIAHRDYGVGVDRSSTIGLLVASLISALPVYILSTSINVVGALLNLLKLVISGLLFLAIYATLLPVFKVISKKDLEFIASIFSKIKPLKPLILLIAKYEEKLIKP
jgi:O-antigen/teichoic acid export membrane protein